MANLLLIAKSHWKKLCFSIPIAYGIFYVKNEYVISQQMANICNLVNKSPIPRNNKVLVVLNPVANKRKCEKMFKKYCEPVLQMAGYAVDVIKTEYVGHAKSIVETLPQLPDVIVIAGGDGTSSEVVTGLVRREEDICPILFLPLGEKSESAFNLMKIKKNSNSEFVENVSQCMLALVQGRIQCRPLMKYEVFESGHTVPSKPIIGLLSFSWGILNDIEINKKRYWYFGALRNHISTIIASLSKMHTENILADIVSIPSCHECSKYEDFAKDKTGFSFSKLLNMNSPKPPMTQIKECIQCSTKKYYKINAKQVDITCKQNPESLFSLNIRAIENFSSRSGFLVNVINESRIQSYISIESRIIEVIPILPEHRNYYIDGESYDVRHIKISLLPNALKYFS